MMLASVCARFEPENITPLECICCIMQLLAVSGITHDVLVNLKGYKF
jgi:hypothetical protein